MSEPAGWYGNPDGTQTQRFWDGAQWTHDVRPIVSPEFDPGQTEVVPEPDPMAGAAATTKYPEPSGSIVDLIGVLFDFGAVRPVTPALARTGYKLGAIIVLIVSALFLLAGLQGGGNGAVVALVVFPLLAVLWLIILRFLCQMLVDRAPTGSTETG